MLDNTDNTFVTPVFNGSASLRNAAGQLIEDVTKAKRRGKTVDGAYIESLYETVSSLYRLDQFEGTENTTEGRRRLGPLPKTSVILLSSLAGAWVLMGAYVGIESWKKSRK